MAEVNYSIDLDLKEVKAMVDNLVPYIYENELYGKINTDSARLTPGSILLRLRRLGLLRSQMNDAQAAQYDKLNAQNESVRKEWAVAYGKKMVQEAESRLRDLQTFIKECKEDAKLCANAYNPEALRRTIVAELIAGLPADVDASALKASVSAVDGGLRRNIRETPFIWAQSLQAAYPQDTFWWLYGRPPQPD
ncbi:MAG: hypothetical protein H0X30_20370 [Anaerolineae bacterium]|nr:hypothetical protein [Anaerolineae bacterium]